MGFGKKKKKVEMKIEKVGDGVLKVSPKAGQKTAGGSKEFYKELESKSVNDFLKEVALKTMELWSTITKLSIKKNMKEHKINQFLVFAESVDVSMAVMRTLKVQLIIHGDRLEMAYKKKFGKSPNLVEAVNQCINIANPEDLKKLGDLNKRRRKNMQSYVA